jgi:phage tail-like protein
MSQPGKRREAFGAYHFKIEVPGGSQALFRSCSGLKSESEVVIVQEGGVNSYEHKLVGRTKWPNLVLKQGFADGTFCKMREQVVSENFGRFNGTIMQLGPGGKVVYRWNFIEGWICKWEGPELDATKNEISIETIEIAHHGLISG